MEESPQIEAKVRKIISAQVGFPIEKVLLKSKIVDDLGADSLDTVELVIKFEEAFGIRIPDDDAERMKTVQDVVRYIQKRTAEAEREKK